MGTTGHVISNSKTDKRKVDAEECTLVIGTTKTQTSVPLTKMPEYRSIYRFIVGGLFFIHTLVFMHYAQRPVLQGLVVNERSAHAMAPLSSDMWLSMMAVRTWDSTPTTSFNEYNMAAALCLTAAILLFAVEQSRAVHGLVVATVSVLTMHAAIGWSVVFSITEMDAASPLCMESNLKGNSCKHAHTYVVVNMVIYNIMMWATLAHAVIKLREAISDHELLVNRRTRVDVKQDIKVCDREAPDYEEAIESSSPKKNFERPYSSENEKLYGWI